MQLRFVELCYGDQICANDRRSADLATLSIDVCRRSTDTERALTGSRREDAAATN